MGNDSPLDPVIVTDPDRIAEICRFRVRVWLSSGHAVPNTFPHGTWRDEWDDTCKHLAIIRDEEIMASARWSLHDSLEQVPEAEQYVRLGLRLEGPIAVAERIAVSPSVPYLGLAWRLLDALDELSRSAGARHAIGQASPAMVRILERRGRRVVGPAAPDPRFPGIPFQIVVRSYP